MTFGRLWVRAAARRPGRLGVIAAGLVATSVATSAALAAGDALDRLFVTDARSRWGAIDVEVTRGDRGVFGEGLAAEFTLQSARAARAQSTRLILSAVGRRGGRTERDVTVLGITTGDRVLGALPRRRGRVDPATLGPDEVAVNARLARRMRLRVGDELPLVVAVPEVPEAHDGTSPYRGAKAAAWRPRVAGITEDAGAADFGRGANVFVRLGPLQRATALAGKVNVIHARAPHAGARAARDLADVYQAKSNELFQLVAAPVKAQAVARADDEGGLFRSVVLALAVIVAAASLVLTAHLAGLLASERSRELALLRALGVRSRRLKSLLTAEGAIAGVGAAVAGALLAVPVGAAVAHRIAHHVAGLESGRGHDVVPLDVRSSPALVAISLLATVVVAIAAAWRAARDATAGNLDAGLRGYAVDRLPSGATPAVVACIGFLLLGIGLGGDVPALLLGGTLTLGGAAWARVRRSPRAHRWWDDAAALLGLTWCLLAPAALTGDDTGVQSTFALLAVAGAGAVACAVLLLTARLRSVVRFARAYLPAGRVQAAVRTSGAWLEADRARTGAVMATVGALAFMIAALSVVGRASAVPLKRQGLFFDVIAETVAAPKDAFALAPPGSPVDPYVFARMGEGSWRVEGAEVPYPVRAIRAHSVFPPPPVGDGRWRLAAAVPGVTSAAEALERVFSSRDEVVVDRYARPEGARPGDTVELDVGSGPQRFKLLAVLDTYLLQGVVFGVDPFDRLFTRTGSSLLFAQAGPGMTPARLARTLERNGADIGLSADTVTEAAADVTRANRVFTDVFGEVLLVGLAVTILGAAASYARAARTRRRELGVLRALGLRRRHLTMAVLTEPLVAAVSGVAIGVAAGLGTLRLLFATSLDDLAFHVDIAQLVVVASTTGLLIAAAALGPSLAAAGVDPDRAVRSPE